MKEPIRTLIALVAVAITIGFLWHTNRVVTPKQATWDDVLGEARKGKYSIVTTEELAGKYVRDPSSLLLVDTRQGWEYRTGHIRGALNFPMEPTWWARWRKKGELEAVLGQDKDRMLVFY